MKTIAIITVLVSLTSCEGLKLKGSIEGKRGVKYTYDGESLEINYKPINAK